MFLFKMERYKNIKQKKGEGETLFWNLSVVKSQQNR